MRATPTLPVADPYRGFADVHDDLEAALGRAVAAGRYVHGPEHAAFERELAVFLGVSHCVGVACGTDALELALLAVGCRSGDEVVTAANAGAYASVAARKAGLRPVYADVDPETLCLTRPTVEAALTPRTSSVIVTHLYGRLAEVDELAALCRERGIALVEDCAQAAGARRAGRRAGAFGDAAAFSFYPTKNLPALGDGGAVATGDADVAERVRRLREYGWGDKYSITVPGGRNSRLDELQAAVLRVGLTRLDERNARRREIVRRYGEGLAPGAGRIVAGAGEEHVAHLAVLLAEDRPAAQAAFERAGIGTAVHFPVADHRQPAWREEYADIRLPVTEHAVDHVLTVPCFPELTDGEVDRVCEVLGGL